MFHSQVQTPQNTTEQLRITGIFFAVGTGFVQVDSQPGSIFLLQRELSLQAVHSTGGPDEWELFPAMYREGPG